MNFINITSFKNIKNKQDIYNNTCFEQLNLSENLSDYLTNGFKQVISKVFTDAFKIKLNEKIIRNNNNFVIKECYLIISDENKINDMENFDCFLVIIFESDREIEFINDNHEENLKSKKNYVKRLLKDIEINSSLVDLENTLINDYPDVKLITLDLKTIKVLDNNYFVLVLLTAFYYYGFIIVNRLNRSQVDIEIGKNKKDSFNNVLINHQVKLINLKRYFLTSNRSLFHEIQKFSKDICIIFNLEKKYTQARDLHLSFDKYFNAEVEISLSKSNKSMKKSLTAITFLGIPLSILSLFFSLKLDSDIIKTGFFNIILNYDILKLSIISLSIPISLIFLTFLAHKITILIKKLFRND